MHSDHSTTHTALMQPPHLKPYADPLHPIWNDSSDDNTGIFGLPFQIADASLVIIPVPWELSCSQGTGTANAPDLILAQSRYVELHDAILGNIYERGIAMAEPSPGIQALIADAGRVVDSHDPPGKALDRLSEQLHHQVSTLVENHRRQNQTVCLLGGDHSISYGSIAAHCREYPDMGVLQIDAHADLRPSLDGMSWSHATIMWQVMENIQPACLTQVGIRALCSVEREYQANHEHISVFFDHAIHAAIAGSDGWLSQCERIIDTLPAHVYLSVDIDGLNSACCPHTGTPVPGGLTYMQVVLLIHQLVNSGRRIVGFDLVEVGGHAEDALIAAHLLYQLSGLAHNRRAA